MNKIPRILSLIQILYQNEEITTEQKNQFVSLLSKARKERDFSELNKQFKFLAYGTLLPDTVDELIQLTS